MARLSVSCFICRSLLSLHFVLNTVPPTFSPPLRHAPSPSTVALTRVGFCMVRERGRRTRATWLRVLKNGSIKVFPALFPVVTARDGCVPCTVIRICIHVRGTLSQSSATVTTRAAAPPSLVHPLHFCGRNSRGNCSIFTSVFHRHTPPYSGPRIGKTRRHDSRLCPRRQ